MPKTTIVTNSLSFVSGTEWRPRRKAFSKLFVVVRVLLHFLKPRREEDRKKEEDVFWIESNCKESLMFIYEKEGRLFNFWSVQNGWAAECLTNYYTFICFFSFWVECSWVLTTQGRLGLEYETSGVEAGIFEY